MDKVAVRFIRLDRKVSDVVFQKFSKLIGRELDANLLRAFGDQVVIAQLYQLSF